MNGVAVRGSIPRSAPSVVEGSAVSVQGDEENDPLLGQTYKVYKRRWYVLAVFSSMACTQAALWNTWGPISETSEHAFGWDNSTIALLSSWGPIAVVITGLLYFWLLQVKGLRWAVVASAFPQAVGSVLRVITTETPTATVLFHLGQFLINMGGPICLGALPALSATWFPVKERVTATAISSSFGILGVSLAFVLGPAVVNDESRDYNSTGTSPSSDVASIRRERENILHYMYYECGWSCLLFFVIVIYFPRKPPHPPCPSAGVERESYWTGMWSLRTKSPYLLLTLAYSISFGLVGAWNALLGVNLKILDVDEDEAGWIGFYGTVSGCLCSLIVGRVADRFAHHIKLFILCMYSLGTICFLLLALLFTKVIPFSHAAMYALVIIGNTTLWASVPLMYEMCCELAYPISEGAANGFLIYMSNVAGTIFLLIPLFPEVGMVWMNWTLAGAMFLCIPLISVIKGQFNRLEVDRNVFTAVASSYVAQEIVVP